MLQLFLSGKPACLQDENNPDWLPTLNLGHSKQMQRKGGGERGQGSRRLLRLNRLDADFQDEKVGHFPYHSSRRHC